MAHTFDTALGHAEAAAEPWRARDWRAWALVAGGGALLSYGLWRRDKTTMAGSLAGAALLYRGIAMVRDPEAGLLPMAEVNVHRTVSVMRPKQELFDYWAKAENLPNFMMDVESVRQTSLNRQHWKMSLPGGLKIEWDAEIRIAGEKISWRTLPGSPVDHSGAIEFRDGNHPGETYVRLTAHYELPGGTVARGAALLAGRDPDQMARENLRHFKQLMETGEIPTTAGQPTGRSRFRNQITESLYHENAGLQRITPKTA